MLKPLVRQAWIAAFLLAISTASEATFHLFNITQLYSNASGSVQYIVLTAYAGSQEFIAGHIITSAQNGVTHTFRFPNGLPGDTATGSGFKSFLIGTQGFAALNLVAPDFVVPNGFFFTSNATVVYGEGAATLSYSALPTEGNLALFPGGPTGQNMPKNFAGATGTIVPSSASVSYEGLWLNGNESGWGVNITHQGTTLFATWFTYDTDGSGMWLVMSNGTQTSAGSFSGTLYRTVGPAFNANPFTSISFPANYTTVGNLSFSFTDANTGTMSYTVNGIAQTKAITRFIFGASGTNCTLGATQSASPNYQDLWLRSPDGSQEAGWGINVSHQGDVLFATWFTYLPGSGSTNKGMWLVMSNGSKTASGVYTGDLQTTTGPTFNAVPFNPGAVVRTTVGTGTFTFTDANNGTFNYTVNGVTQSKPIARYIYSSPATVCQ